MTAIGLHKSPANGYMPVALVSVQSSSVIGVFPISKSCVDNHGLYGQDGRGGYILRNLESWIDPALLHPVQVRTVRHRNTSSRCRLPLQKRYDEMERLNTATEVGFIIG